MFRRFLAAPLLTSALVLGVVACGSDEAAEPAATTGAPTPETTTTEATTTSTEPTTTTAPAPTGAETAADAAWTLYDAWGDDNREAAATVAEPEAIESIWAAVPGPYELYRHCDDGEFDTGGCLFRDRTTNHTIQINLERRDGLWVIVSAIFSEE